MSAPTRLAPGLYAIPSTVPALIWSGPSGWFVVPISVEGTRTGGDGIAWFPVLGPFPTKAAAVDAAHGGPR